MNEQEKIYFKDIIETKVNEYESLFDDPTFLRRSRAFNGLLSFIGTEIFNNRVLKVNSGNIKTNINYNDLEQLDFLFYLYSQLCARYDQRLTMQAFYTFINCTPNFFKNIISSYNNTSDTITTGYTKELEDLLNKFYNACELSLISGDKISDIFLLKSVYKYKDNGTDQTVNDDTIVISDIPENIDTYSKLLLSGPEV